VAFDYEIRQSGKLIALSTRDIDLEPARPREERSVVNSDEQYSRVFKQE
jgi:hypothetical protein